MSENRFLMNRAEGRSMSPKPDDLCAGSPESRLDDESVGALREALHRYFDLMYDCDLSNFDNIFAPTVQLHGFRDGTMQCWSAGVYRDILANRTSPKSLGAQRDDALLLLDFASATQALTKVRVRIASMHFIDYLTWHRQGGRWLVTSKGFHLDSMGPV
jgi:hypothetical protein